MLVGVVLTWKVVEPMSTTRRYIVETLEEGGSVSKDLDLSRSWDVMVEGRSRAWDLVEVERVFLPLLILFDMLVALCAPVARKCGILAAMTRMDSVARSALLRDGIGEPVSWGFGRSWGVMWAEVLLSEEELS